MANKFIDVASYQPDTLAYFQAAKKLGVKGVVVKITEGSAQGTNYVNPKASRQISNAKKAGLTVSVYHFLRSISVADAKQEAQFFLQEAKKCGIKSSDLWVVDVEAAELTHNSQELTKQVNAFLAELQTQGSKKLAVYSSTSWFTGRMVRSQLQYKTWWVASYDTKDAGIPCAAWQYSDRQMITEAKTDISLDYSGVFTGQQGAGKGSQKETVSKQQNKVPQKSWVDELGVRWYQEQGTFKTDRAIYLRWGATTKSAQITLLPAGSVIKYDGFAHSGGYIWLRQNRGQSKFGYLASGESQDGKRTSYWGSFLSR